MVDAEALVLAAEGEGKVSPLKRYCQPPKCLGRERAATRCFRVGQDEKSRFNLTGPVLLLLLPQNSSASTLRQHHHYTGDNSAVMCQPIYADKAVGLGFHRYSLWTNECTAPTSVLRYKLYLPCFVLLRSLNRISWGGYLSLKHARACLNGGC